MLQESPILKQNIQSVTYAKDTMFRSSVSYFEFIPFKRTLIVRNMKLKIKERLCKAMMRH